MQNNEIKSIKVAIEFEDTQSACASYEVSAGERLEMLFCNNLMPVYPMALYVVTRNKSGGSQILNAVEILKTV